MQAFNEEQMVLTVKSKTVNQSENNRVSQVLGVVKGGVGAAGDQNQQARIN